MVATAQNFSIPAGNTRTLEFLVTVTDYEFDESAAVCEWRMADSTQPTTEDQIRISKSSEDPGGYVRLVREAGDLKLYVDLLPEDTIDLTPGKFYHEAQVKVSGELRDTIAMGSVTVLPTFIRP
jgi:hypothetical protein